MNDGTKIEPGDWIRHVEGLCQTLAQRNEQIDKLATFEGAIDTAIRIIAQQAQTIAQQTQELQQERDKCDAMRNRFPVDAASWRGVDEQDLCAECGGSGTKLYSNTSTCHYSAGGQAMTLSVCDKCWGSGNKHKPWRSWKLADQQAQEHTKLGKLYEDLLVENHAHTQEIARLKHQLNKLCTYHEK